MLIKSKGLKADQNSFALGIKLESTLYKRFSPPPNQTKIQKYPVLVNKDSYFWSQTKIGNMLIK